MGEAGIVDHDVDAAEFIHRGLHHGIHFLLARDIRMNRNGSLANIPGNLLRTLQIEIGDKNPGALFGKALGHPLAKT